MEQVPTIRLESLTDDQIRAYVIADNRIAEKAGWDKSILAIELQHLLTIDLNFEVTITGFEVAEVDLILAETRKKQDEDDIFDIDETRQAVTQAGDLWQLGKHRVLCGNALETASFKSLMAIRRAHLVFVDPLVQCANRGPRFGKRFGPAPRFCDGLRRNERSGVYRFSRH